MEQILIFILMVIAIVLIALVLLQHGKGADVGANFGSGASNTVFGSVGAASFLMKLTMSLAVIFFIICIVLTRLATVQANHNDVLSGIMQQQQQPQSLQHPDNTVPAVPAAATKNNAANVPVVPSK